MIDSRAAQLAFRNRALTLEVAATGTMALAAVADGYTRSDGGSFITDGFLVGMEFKPAGFNANAYHVATAVTASKVSVGDTLTAETSAAGRSLTVGFPEGRAWENTTFTPTAGPTSGRVHVEEDFLVSTTEHRAGSYANGVTRETGLYVLKWYGLAGKGIGAIRACTDALKDLFTPGTALTAGSHTVTVRGDIGPRVGELLPLEGGWTVATLTVPWWATTSNA